MRPDQHAAVAHRATIEARLEDAEHSVSCDRRQPIDIEALLIWTFARQRAHIVGARGERALAAMLAGHAPDSILRCRRLAEQGGRVDGGGPPADHVHADADLVASLVRDETVIRYAEAFDRPDWLPGARVRIVPMLDARGRIVRGHEPWDVHRNWGWCRVTCPIEPQQIARARARYVAWHAELVRLASAGEMQRLLLWRVTGPRVFARPWLPESG